MWIEKLYGEQPEALDFICSRAGTLLIGDVGSGKTLVTLAAIEKTRPHYTMIVVPLTSIDVTWSPRLELPMKHDGKLTVVRTWEEFKQQRAQERRCKTTWPIVLLVHFEYFSKIAGYAERVPWDFVAIDETQGLKARKSKRSRAGRRMRHAKRRLALTGTPLDSSPIDVWAQMRFVNVDLFGDDFGDFAAEYCRRGGFKNHSWLFRPKKTQQFLDACRDNVFRLEKAFMDLPPVTVEMVPVTLLGEQARIYRQMETHGIVKIGRTTIPASLMVTRQGKLEQITGGTILDLDLKSHHIGDAKVRALRRLVKRLGNDSPVVITCKYLAEIPLIKRELKGRVGVLTGAVKDGPKGKERTNLITGFQAGKYDYLIFQTKTGGVSIELTRSHKLIFYSQSFSLIDFEQIKGRFDRGGQLHPVQVFVIFAEDTRDVEIASEIEKKYGTHRTVVDAFKQPAADDARAR